MAFENNFKALLDYDYSPFETIGAALAAIESEAKRIAYIKGISANGLDCFEKLALWDAGKVPAWNPDFTGEREPSLVFFPGQGKAPRGIVLVVPGGGYNIKAYPNEGLPTVRRLVESGFSAALLDYRVKPYTQYVSLMDIQRAIRVLRCKSEDLRIKPDKIAVCGFSAGGHLSSMASVHFDDGIKSATDPVERVSCRPDAAIIGYGIFSQTAFPVPADGLVKMQKDHEEDLGGLISSYSDTRDIRDHKIFFSPENHISSRTPPFFMWQTLDEDDPRQLFNLAGKLADYEIRFEAHVFPYGPHGLGLADGSSMGRGRFPHVMHWSELAIEWLEDMKF